MINKTYKILILVAGIILLGSIGYVAALNGWFGGGSSIPPDTMTRGLVGYWNMDEGGGNTAKDSSGNGNNGALTNGPQWTKGKNGGALKFDGVDDYVDVGDNSILDIGNAVTVSAWVYANTLPAGRYSHMVDKNDEYAIYFYENELRCKIGPSTRSLVPSFPTKEWHFILCAWDGTNQRLYVDSILKDTDAQGSVTSTSNILYLGADSPSKTSVLDGVLDDVRIYNRALSPAEIFYHYNAGKPAIRWEFNEGSGTTIHDTEGNLNISFPADPGNQPTWTKP